MATTITTPIKIRCFKHAEDTTGQLETFDSWLEAKNTLKALDSERAASKDGQMLFAPSANERASGIASSEHYAIVLDYDHASDEGLEELKRVLRERNFDALILPTYSDGKNGERRFRLVLGVNTPIPAKQVAAVRLGVARLLGVEGFGEPEARDAKRVFYLGAGRESWRHDGDLLDWREFAAKPVSTDPINIDDPSVVQLGRLSRAYDAWVSGEHWAEQGERNSTLLQIFSQALREHPTITEEMLVTLTRPSLDTVGLPIEEVERVARNAVNYSERDDNAELDDAGWNLSSDDLTETLPPINYLVPELDIAAGPPTIIAGCGFGGKSMALQALAVSIVGKKPVWGRFSASGGRALYLDYEQGKRLTYTRFQRLARAAGVNPNGALTVATLPRKRLDSAGIEAELARLVEGYRVCCIDSLRACAPSLDENSSEVRSVLDMLTRVSEASGCAFIVLHHARKPQQGTRSDQFALRGSSAIFEACSSVLVFEPRGESEPVRVHPIKARNSGRLAEKFELQIADTLDGVEVLALDAPAAETPSARLAAAESKLLELVRANPGASTRQLRELGGGRSTTVSAALDGLRQRNQIWCNNLSGGRHAWFPVVENRRSSGSQMREPEGGSGTASGTTQNDADPEIREPVGTSCAIRRRSLSSEISTGCDPGARFEN